MKDFMDELDMELASATPKTPDSTAKTQAKTVSKPQQASRSSEKKSHSPKQKNTDKKPQHHTSGARSSKSVRQQSSSSMKLPAGKYTRNQLEFPETKFFLPTLRE